MATDPAAIGAAVAVALAAKQQADEDAETARITAAITAALSGPATPSPDGVGDPTSTTSTTTSSGETFARDIDKELWTDGLQYSATHVVCDHKEAGKFVLVPNDLHEQMSKSKSGGFISRLLDRL